MRRASIDTRVCLFCNSKRPTSILQLPSIWRWQASEIGEGGRNFHSSSHRQRKKPPVPNHVRNPAANSKSRWADRPRVSQSRSPSTSFLLYTNKRLAHDRSPLEDMQAAAWTCLNKMRSLLNDKAFQLETGLSESDAEERFSRFEKLMLQAIDEEPYSESMSMRRSILLEAFSTKRENGLFSQLKYMFAAMLANQKFKHEDIVNQIRLTDLRYPPEWYPRTRTLTRTIHLHIGPTNSGKTYHALKRLESAATGCYAGPLRLLAHEIFTRLRAKGKPCSLVTGDEMIMADTLEASQLWSCTVEMVPLNAPLEVAVIDEIQMMSDPSRGWAWTQAVLGLKAKELHLCGEARILPLIQQIASSIGDKLVVHNYERLSPLQVSEKSLDGNLDSLQKGDCVVSFSKRTLHSLKKEIQEKTGKDVAIVYGTLPPETRAQQARLFNDPSNSYDVLVASDAIGMGLNLSVKRIIFETLSKYNGSDFTPVSIASIKQIGGRAGRYRTAEQDNAIAQSAATGIKDASTMTDLIPPKPAKENMGYVTTLYKQDLSHLRRAMLGEASPILSAVIKPPDEMVMRFAAHFPHGTPLSYILLRLNEISRVHPRYEMCEIREQADIADMIQQVEGLNLAERLLLTYAPIDAKVVAMRPVVLAMARCIATRKGGGLLEIPEINLEILDLPVPMAADAQEYIMAISATHQAVVLYLWLSYRFPNIFHSQALAFHTKGLLQEKLDVALASARLRNIRRKTPPRNRASEDIVIPAEARQMQQDHNPS